jgi:hypothetical protein
MLNEVRSLRVKFIGLFDAVRAIGSEEFFHMPMTENVQHLRHALALLEMRTAFKPMRFLPLKEPLLPDQSCREGWFLGDHGNVGGSKEDDGLSLWALQWILTEAQENGLVLGFTGHKRILIPNPIENVFPTGAKIQDVRYRNGLVITLWDLSTVFAQPGFLPDPDRSESKLGDIGTSERAIFDGPNTPIGHSNDRMCQKYSKEHF